ncbi:AMP-binding enzyme, partial [Bacillus atrophaeus]
MRGFRIELSEIESKLAEHTAIKQVTVQTIDSNENGKQLVAYYVREKSNSQIDINDLQESLATQLRYSFVYP